MILDIKHLYNKSTVLNDDASSAPRRVHLFDPREVDAIDTALKGQRPLLLRGEPGVGKTQLAEAFAKEMRWALFSKTLDANTDPNDLKWTEDAVARLAAAQLAAVPGMYPSLAEAKLNLSQEKFLEKGPLWRAFEHDEPSVVLIDEIDKADLSVPNALLEALGAARFSVPFRSEPIEARNWPLVILTTNEERPLPPAFLRRCFVLNMDPPKDIKPWLVARGAVVHGESHAKLLGHVADAVLKERIAAEKQRLEPLPGLAEYLDLLRVLFADPAKDDTWRRMELESISDFSLQKHRTR